MATAKTKKKPLTIARVLPYILIIGGIIGFICAAVITYDELKLAANPDYIPSCNLNPIIACGSVMSSKQAHAFGFPNPFIGFAAFPILLTVGVTWLASGAVKKRWYWLGLEAGTIFGVGFIHWLFFQSVYRIHALCPWCMVVWVITITTFWYTTLYNIDNKHIKLPAGKATSFYTWVRRHHLDLLVLWFLIIAFFIFKHFWYYFGKHLF